MSETKAAEKSAKTQTAPAAKSGGSNEEEYVLVKALLPKVLVKGATLGKNGLANVTRADGEVLERDGKVAILGAGKKPGSESADKPEA